MKKTIERRLKSLLIIGLLMMLQFNCFTYAVLPGGEELYPAEVRTKEGDFYGYINKKGEWVIKPEYDLVLPFSEGVGVVGKDNLFGLIDYKGKEIVSPQYESIGTFKEGRGTFVNKEGMGVLDTKGKVITKKYYGYVGDYSEGLAIVLEKQDNGKRYYGYINRKGDEVIVPTYEAANDFVNGKALVQTEEQTYALINKKGQVLTVIHKPVVYGYQDGAMIYSDSIDGLRGYLDTKGDVLIPAEYTFAEPFEDGVAVVGNSSGYTGEEGLIDRTGKWIYEPTFDEIHYLGEERVALGKVIDITEPSKGTLYAIGDVTGNQLTNFIYEGVSSYKEGLASAYDEKETFFIGLDGQKINSLPTVEGAGTLEELDGIIKADVDGEVSYLTSEGRVIYRINDIIPLNDTKRVQVKKYRPNINYVVYYPEVILEGQPEIEQQINQALKAFSIPENVQPNQTLDYTYEGDVSIQFYNQDLLVPRLTGSTFYFGAAHPIPNLSTPAINLRTGAIYKLSDLFETDSMWQIKIGELLKEMATTDPMYKDILFKPIQIPLDENQSFYVDQDNLVLYYAPYEIGPYAAGFITFKIPFNQINYLINKEGSLWQAFH